jgi:ribonuclease HI
MKLLLYSDGGSRGNPGPAAYGFIISSTEGAMLKKGSRFLGTMTNNEAEYRGLIAVLDEALKMGGTDITITMDSELVVKQVKGEYRMKAENLLPLMQQVREQLKKFSSYQIRHVRREDPTIQKADSLVNEELDICTLRIK